MRYIVTLGDVAAPPATGTLATVPWVRNERAATAGLKTTSYADNVIALAYARERGAIEAVFANTRDELCEATGSNIFVVRDGEVVTPPLDSGCLAGVTRELAIEWARAAGIPVREEAVPMAEAPAAEEVFITSSTKDVLPVSGWDARAYDAPGPVTRAVVEAWRAGAAEGMDP